MVESKPFLAIKDYPPMSTEQVEQLPRIYMALPKYAPGGSSTTVPYDILDCSDHLEQLYVPSPKNKSLLARNFNTMWTDALNLRKSEGITHWLIHHDDIDVHTEKYVDVMMSEMARMKCKVISAVVPIKDPCGLTTTGYRSANPHIEQNDIKRFVMKEIMRFPETFGREGAGLNENQWLMINTGLLLIDIRDDWVEKFSFEIRDWMIHRPDGTFVPTGISEDWKFSCFLAMQKIPYCATRKVRLVHWGAMAYPNFGNWGHWDTDRGVVTEDQLKAKVEPDSQSQPPNQPDAPAAQEIPEGKLRIVWHAGVAPSPGTSVNAISVADPGTPRFTDTPYGCNVTKRLHLEFHDIGGPRNGMVEPSLEHALKIVAFAKNNRDLPVVLQCVDGRFRSQAIAAGLTVLEGMDDRIIRRRGTYNRLLYDLIRTAGNNPTPPPPKVSIVVAAWQPDHFHAFLLCMQAQRHKNWELIAVTDGPAPWIDYFAGWDSRLRIIETEEHKGFWGHPHRQTGINAATGDFIGLQNDDNYLTPGYLEQLLCALEDDRADIAMCHMLHNYFGWGHIGISLDPIGVDLGCWIARSHVVKAIPFSGTMATSDQTYVQGMISYCGINRVAIIKRPIYIHN